jgi:hypothetical protein
MKKAAENQPKMKKAAQNLARKWSKARVRKYAKTVEKHHKKASKMNPKREQKAMQKKSSKPSSKRSIKGIEMELQNEAKKTSKTKGSLCVIDGTIDYG